MLLQTYYLRSLAGMQCYGGTMTICEIFSSIQGESTFQGTTTVFVRTSECNLRCAYCDTPYAWNGGVEMSISDILKRVVAERPRHVCITGGEPLLQKDTPLLAAELAERGFIVSLETNGTIDAAVLDPRVKRIIDIKCPDSGEHNKTHPNNLADIRPSDEFKFVISGRGDFEYTCDYTKKYGLLEKAVVLLSPVKGIIDPATLAGWILDELPDARLNLQLHKFIWPGDSHGR